MTVYVVMCGECADKYPNSAWSTEEKAREHMALLKATGSYFDEPWDDPIAFEVDPS